MNERAETMVTLTPAHLDAGRSRKGCLNQRQLAILGEPIPLREGWKWRLLGKKVLQSTLDAFLAARTKDSAKVAKSLEPTLFTQTQEKEQPLAFILTPPRLYCDGGVIGRNPSPYGGTWAYVHVGDEGDDNRVGLQMWGIVEPFDVGTPMVTNNMTELLSVLYGMESLPEGWAGRIYTDSQVTQWRTERRAPGLKKAKMAGITQVLQDRVDAARERLGNYTVVLLGGHPSKEELLAGVRKDGMPCSPYNVLCDELCAAAARTYWAKHPLPT